MASCLPKLLKRPQPTKLIFSLQTQHSPNLTASPVFLNNQTHIDSGSDHNHYYLDSAQQKTEKVTHFNSSIFYPSFSFGFTLNPILSTGLIPSEPEDGVSDGGSGMVWADSVKKKRKKKMNKHKYKKLRKRLRRQT